MGTALVRTDPLDEAVAPLREAVRLAPADAGTRQNCSPCTTGGDLTVEAGVR